MPAAGNSVLQVGSRGSVWRIGQPPRAATGTFAMEIIGAAAIMSCYARSESLRQLKRPSKNHHWRFGLTGPLRFTPLDGVQTSARILSDAEIRELGYVLVEADSKEVLEARRMCQIHHPDRGGDPDMFMRWKYKLDKLRRRV